MSHEVCRINIKTLCWRIFTADQRLSQAMRMADIIKTKPALYTKTTFICRAINTLNKRNIIIFNFQADLTANTAERTYRFYLFVKILTVAPLCHIKNAGWHQSACWASLYAFPTRNTAAASHWIIKVKYRIGVMTTTCHAYHVIHLNFTAGTHT